mgnify:FL=1
MASDESSVRVTINRISGDSQSCIAEQRETVGALKVRLADQLSVPPMCQRWIIEEPSLQTHEHVANCIAARMEQLLDQLDQRRVHELMGLHRAPAPLEACLEVVIELISGNEQLKQDIIAFKKAQRAKQCADEHGATGGPNLWSAILPIVTKDVRMFLRALESFPDDVRKGAVKGPYISAAKKKIEELGTTLLHPERMRSISYVGWMLNSWAKLALKFFEGTRPASGFLPLEDCVELAGCKGDGEELSVSLVVDIEPAISCLGTHVLPANFEQEAVKALKVVGRSDPQRSIHCLAPRLFHGGETGCAAAAAVCAICEMQKDDPGMPDLLLKELQDFLDAGLQRAFRDVMEVLERVVPTGNEKVLQWIVLILAKGCDEDQEIGLQHFANLQQHCDADSGIKFIMDRLFGLDGWSEWHNISESGEKSLIKALVLVSPRQPDAVRNSLLDLLQDGNCLKATRSTKLIVALGGADEALVKAALSSVEAQSSKGESWAVLEMCESLKQVSDVSQVYQILLRELQTKKPHKCEGILKAMYDCGPMDGSLEALAGYLQHANRIRRDEGPEPLLEAAKITDLYIKTFNDPKAKQLKSIVKAALAKGIAESGDKKCSEALPEIVDFEGEGEEVLEALARGLKHPSPKVRLLCYEVFLQICHPDDPRAFRVLIRSIEQEIVGATKCLQIKLLGDVAPRNQQEVIDLLLHLAEESDACIRSSALAQLGYCASMPHCSECLRKHLLEKDEQVRIACLESLLYLEEDPGALQALCSESLKDDASSIVLLVLKKLEALAILEKEEQCCHSLAPLLFHGDPQVRQAVCVLLGTMKHEGRSIAESILQRELSWREHNSGVLEAKRKALDLLQGKVNNEGDEYDDGEEVEE